MIKFVTKNGIEYDVLESFLNIDYSLKDGEVSHLKYCVEGLIPGSNHFPEVVTLAVCDDLSSAIRIHYEIMCKLGLNENFED